MVLQVNRTIALYHLRNTVINPEIRNSFKLLFRDRKLKKRFDNYALSVVGEMHTIAIENPISIMDKTNFLIAYCFTNIYV
jgi:hypothetical protein